MRVFFFLSIALLLEGCAGTIKTVHHTDQRKYSKAYIISSDQSEYVKFKFGTFTYFGYIPPADGPSETRERIGNTDTIIKYELEKRGISATLGKKGDTPEGYDLIVTYDDIWRWDFKKILQHLDIYFISPRGDSVLATSTFDIYYNKELHNFPTPKKEVPKMIEELLKK